MFDFLLKGGPVMVPIILGSVIGLAIVLDRFWIFRQTAALDTFEFVEKIFRLIKAEKFKEAVELCSQNKQSPIAAIYKVGIERRELPIGRLEKIIEQVGNNQVQKLEKYLGALVSVIGIEPLLGFLGTITGLIRAFMSWEKSGANVTVSALAGGIYEAMLTTAAGLMVAIPLYICYNFFISRIKYISNDLTNHGIQLLEILTDARETKASRP